MKKAYFVQLVILTVAVAGFSARAQEPSVVARQSFAASLNAISVKAMKDFKPLPRSSAASLKPAFVSLESEGEVSGGGTVSGFGDFFCSQTNGAPGFMSGGVMLNGTVDVSGPGGVHGNIPVSGNILMSGQCFYGSGNVSGIGTVSGSGTVYGADGKPTGTAQVSGTVTASAFVSSAMASITQYVSVSGTVQ